MLTRRERLTLSSYCRRRTTYERLGRQQGISRSGIRSRLYRARKKQREAGVVTPPPIMRPPRYMRCQHLSFADDLE